MNEAHQFPKPSVLAERGLLPPEAADRATALAAERRRPERCRNRDQELKREPFPCLINSAGSSTYPARKSVRRPRATPRIGGRNALEAAIAQELPYDGAVLLLDPSLVVLAV